MKNEILAQALTNIDDALIAEADEAPAKSSKITSRTLMRNIYRWGAVAACALIAVGVLLAGNLGGPDVLLYGESLADTHGTIYEYMPLAIVDVEDINIPLELEFKKETKLTAADGVMLVIDENGETLYEGNEYLASGKTSIILTLPANTEEFSIETDRGYNIVLTRNTESGIWYVNIEK